MTLPSSEQRYIALRRRLDQLGFQQPLGMESLPLVQRLLADLVRTTTSLKNARAGLATAPPTSAPGNESASVAMGIALGKSSLESYKNENARLVKENTEVHLKLLKEKEDHEKTAKETKSSHRKLEHQNTDLRFLNTQYLHKMKVGEQESNDKTKRILKLQEKNFQAVVHTPGGQKKSIPFRRQRMDIESLLPSDVVTTPKWLVAGDAMPAPKVYIDLVALADLRIASLEKELAESENHCALTSSAVKSLQSQVDARETEMARLRRLLDGGRPEAAVDAAAREDAMTRMAERMNDQINMLREENKSLLDQIADLKGGNVMISEKESVEKTEQSLDPMAIKEELESLSIKVDNLKTSKEKALKEKENEILDLKQKLKEAKDEMEMRLSEVSENAKLVDVEKSVWAKRMNDLEENEISFEEKLRQSEEALGRATKEREDLRRLLTCAESQSLDIRKSLSELEADHRSCAAVLEEEKFSHMTTRNSLLEAEGRHNAAISGLEAEAAQCKQALQEKSNGKDRLQLKLVQIQQELEHTQMQILKGQNKDYNENVTDPSSTDRLVAHSVVKRLESERESLLSDRKRLTEEKAASEAQIQAAARNSVETQSTFIKQKKELENRIEVAETERDNFATECRHHRNTLESLQQHLACMESQLKINTDQLNSERAHVTELMSQVSSYQTESLDLRRQLTELTSSMQAASDEVVSKEIKVKDVRLKLEATQAELEKAKSSLILVDRQRDSAQESLDDKTEELAELQKNFSAVKNALREKNEEITSMEKELDRLTSELGTKENQLRHLQDGMKEQSTRDAETGLEREALRRRNTELARDVHELVLEVESLNNESASLRGSIAGLEVELGRERLNTTQASEMIEGSQTQHEAMLRRFQVVSSQMLQLEERVRDVEGENLRLRTEIEARHYEQSHLVAHVHELQTRLHSSEEERSINDSNSHSLATEVDDLKTDLNNAAQTIATLQHDLSSLRSLAAQLDASKDKLQLELANKDSLCQQLDQEIVDRRMECQALRSALANEQTSVVGLETLVASTREKEFVGHMQLGKMREELEQRQRDLVKAKQTIHGQTSEVESLRRVAADLESSKSLLEAEVTNLQYEAELSGRSRDGDDGARPRPHSRNDSDATLNGVSGFSLDDEKNQSGNGSAKKKPSLGSRSSSLEGDTMTMVEDSRPGLPETQSSDSTAALLADFRAPPPAAKPRLSLTPSSRGSPTSGFRSPAVVTPLSSSPSSGLTPASRGGTPPDGHSPLAFSEDNLPLNSVLHATASTRGRRSSVDPAFSPLQSPRALTPK